MLAEDFDYGGFADPEECQEAGQLHSGDGVFCYVFSDGSVLVAEEAPEQHVDVLGTYTSLELARAEHPELPLVADPPPPPPAPAPPPPPLDPWTTVPDLRHASYGEITFEAASAGRDLSNAQANALAGELVLLRGAGARAWMDSEQGRWAVEPRRSLYRMPADWQPTATGWRADAARKGISAADLDRIQERIPRIWTVVTDATVLVTVLERQVRVRDMRGFYTEIRLHRGIMLHWEGRTAQVYHPVEAFQFPEQDHILLVDWKNKDLRWSGSARAAELGFALGREARYRRKDGNATHCLYQSYHPLPPAVDLAALTRQLCDGVLAEMAKYPENGVPDLPRPPDPPKKNAWDR